MATPLCYEGDHYQKVWSGSLAHPTFHSTDPAPRIQVVCQANHSPASNSRLEGNGELVHNIHGTMSYNAIPPPSHMACTVVLPVALFNKVRLWEFCVYAPGSDIVITRTHTVQTTAPITCLCIAKNK